MTKSEEPELFGDLLAEFYKDMNSRNPRQAMDLTICDEMARRLRKLDEEHSDHGHDGSRPYCKGCFVGWPCPSRRILDGDFDAEV